MAMGTRETDQPPLWVATSNLPTSPGHPFYARLTTLLDGHDFDRFVEGLCHRFSTGMVDYDAFGNPGAAAPVPRVEDVMKKLFIRLRSRTGHDFSSYKPNTIQRRVKRRMSVHQIDSPEEYVEYLRETPAEAEA
jgi:hypothetical protein